MTVTAELHDGRKLEFPDGTDPAVVQATVKKVLGVQGVQAEKRPDATAGERTSAAQGGVNKGIAGLLGLPVDTIENVANLLRMNVGIPAAALGRPDLAPEQIQGSFGGSQYIANKMQQAGANTQNPRPDDAASRMLYSGGKVVGGSMVPGAGVKNTLTAAAGASVAGEALGPEYEGVGAMAPGAVVASAQAAKNAVANPQTVQKNIQTFKEAGTTPDVAQATDSNFFRGLTNVVGRVPGGQGVIAKFREQEQITLGKSANTGVSAEAGGRAIKEGITGEGGFLERTKAQWQKLDNDLATKVGNASAAPANTVKALDELTAVTPGAEKTTGSLVNQKIAEIKQNIQADLQANNGVLPFEALRSLRSKVGSMLDDSLVSGIPNGELKKLYGGLSKDLEAAANTAGAGKEFARQSGYYKARMDRIENTLDSVLGKNRDPEAIFKSVAPSDAESVNKIRRVMRSLEPDERQVVSEAVVNRLGRATPGKQDVTGEKFSSETFLTNWSKINDNAKAQLFPDATMRAKLNAIADVSDNIRSGKAVFANASGTAGGATAAGIYASPMISLGTGNVAPMVVAGSMIVGANVGAKMLTSPKIVDWLAKSSKTTTPEQMTAQLGRLAVIYNDTKDEKLKQELGQYINSVK